MSRTLLAALAFATVTTVATRAHAETRRVAVVVGHNTGGATQTPLRFAEDDAGKFADVLIDLGDVDAANLFLVQGKNRAAVEDALARATRAVKAVRAAPDDRVILLFFYSGHSNEQALELGGQLFTYAELKARLAASGADVRVAVVDGCKSGHLVQTKGGSPGPSFEIGLADELATRGEAMLTSSAANEAALESNEIRGSFFTHHLVSGLRGAADASGDGRVTLSEGYDYAFNRTVSSSSAVGLEPQHPNYDYRLSGRGELVLTEVGTRNATVRLPAGFTRALLVHVRRDQIIAELTRDQVRTIAVAPGDYAIRLWKGTDQVAGRVTAYAGGVTDVSWSTLTTVAPARVAGKGTTPVPDTRDDEAPLPPAAQAEWDRLHLTVGGTLVLEQGPHQSAKLASVNEVYQGVYRRKLDTEVFLRLTGRVDLAKQMEARRLQRQIMMVGGGVVAVGGFVYAVAGERCDPDVYDPDFSPCLHRKGTAMKIGVTAALVGTGILLIGKFTPTRRPPPHVLSELAADYNRDLRARLRRGEPGTANTARRSLQIAPWIDRRGGGLVVAGRL